MALTWNDPVTANANLLKATTTGAANDLIGLSAEPSFARSARDFELSKRGSRLNAGPWIPDFLVQGRAMVSASPWGHYLDLPFFKQVTALGSFGVTRLFSHENQLKAGVKADILDAQKGGNKPQEQYIRLAYNDLLGGKYNWTDARGNVHGANEQDAKRLMQLHAMGLNIGADRLMTYEMLQHRSNKAGEAYLMTSAGGQAGLDQLTAQGYKLTAHDYLKFRKEELTDVPGAERFLAGHATTRQAYQTAMDKAKSADDAKPGAPSAEALQKVADVNAAAVNKFSGSVDRFAAALVPPNPAYAPAPSASATLICQESHEQPHEFPHRFHRPLRGRVRLARDGSVYVAGDGADAIGHTTTSGTGGQAIVELWGEGVVLITAAAPFPAGTGLRTVADGRGAGGQAWCVALQPAAEAGDRIQALRIGTARIQTTPDDPPDEQKAGGKPRAVRSGASPADLRAFASSYARKHDAPAEPPRPYQELICRRPHPHPIPSPTGNICSTASARPTPAPARMRRRSPPPGSFRVPTRPTS